jgi:hypothetical protein
METASNGPAALFEPSHVAVKRMARMALSGHCIDAKRIDPRNVRCDVGQT